MRKLTNSKLLLVNARSLLEGMNDQIPHFKKSKNMSLDFGSSDRSIQHTRKNLPTLRIMTS